MTPIKIFSVLILVLAPVLEAEILDLRVSQSNHKKAIVNVVMGIVK